MQRSLSSKTKNKGPLTSLLWASPKRSDSKRIDVDCTNEEGSNTVLVRTVCYGDYPHSTKALLRAGANLERTDEHGRNALILNSLHGHSN